MHKKVAVFIPILTSLRDWEMAGILNRELYIYQEHFMKNGTTFSIFTSGGDEDLVYEKKFKGIKIIPLNLKKPLKLALILPFLPLKFFKLFKEIDLIKIDQMWSAWIGLWFALVHRKKVWARMGYEHYQFQVFQNTHILKRCLMYILSWLTYHKASVITATTEDIKKFIIEKFHVSASKIKVRANYIDTNLFKRAKQPELLKRILFIGRLDVVKNLNEIVLACVKNEVGLDIIGRGPQKDELVELIKGSNADVNFLGIVANESLPKVIENYKYFILASHHEGNPKSLLEAMSMECTCIATDVPGIRGTIVDGKTGFLANVDNESISRAIHKAMNSNTSAVEKEARNYVLENNSLEKLVAFENDLL